MRSRDNRRHFILNRLTRRLDFVNRVDEGGQDDVNRRIRLSHSNALSLTATDSFETQFSATRSVGARVRSRYVPGNVNRPHTLFRQSAADEVNHGH